MSDIIAPEDVNAPVTMLPAHQMPYGSDTPLTRHFQSILFHYGIRQDEADILEEEQIYSVVHARYANPDGDQDEKDCFEGMVSPHRPFGLCSGGASACFLSPFPIGVCLFSCVRDSGSMWRYLSFP